MAAHHEAMGFPSSAPLARALRVVTWPIPSWYKGEGAKASGVVYSVTEATVEWYGDAPSPCSMRCERLGAEGSVRSLYLWCDMRGKATCLIGPLQSHWAGSGGNGLRARSGALWAGGDATGD